MSTMYSPPWRTARRDAAVGQAVEPPPGRACCCPARAIVQVVLPPSAARKHPTDLLLCGHHYRVSRATLAAMRARVTVLPTGSPDGAPTALLPGVPPPRVPAR